MGIAKGILIAVLCVCLLALVFVGVTAAHNTKEMNSVIDAVLAEIRKHFDMKTVECGSYGTMKVSGMKFLVDQYKVNGIGNLCVMRVNIGIMQMVTLVLTSVERDLPLFSMDYMYMLGNRMSYLEFFDLVLDKGEKYQTFLSQIAGVRKSYDRIADKIPASAWYDAYWTESIHKQGKKKDDAVLHEMAVKAVDVLMQYAESLPVLDEAAHTEKAKLQKIYSDGLVEQGGVSTDAFVKSLGKDATKKFFDEVMFKAE